MILLIDFGSQTAHLIARRIRDFGVDVVISEPENALKTLSKGSYSGFILSGGPASVYEKGAPSVDKEIFDKKIPVLTICYGLQLLAHLTGGKVVSGKKEYGPAELKIVPHSPILKSIPKFPKNSTVWMSHGDEVVTLPSGFEVYASTQDVPHAFVGNSKKKIYGVQFHPEVDHTEYGSDILEWFVKVCGEKIGKKEIVIEHLVKLVKERVGESCVIGAVSGGVDSTVAAVVTAKAIGKKFFPVYVDNGLMRPDARQSVIDIFAHVGIKPIIVDAKKEILSLLSGVTDSEEKRKIIGKHYIDVFERELENLEKKGIKPEFLMQGTIYSDVIESKGTKHAAHIKSHHNVGGLPKHMRLKLLEPVRDYYKDEVRTIGEKLGIPHEFVWRQTFPGPGFAVRIRGEVTPERLAMEEKADEIVVEELKKAGVFEKVYMSFPIMTGAYSTAVKGDGRSFSEVVALRIIESRDVMTTTWARLPYDLLQKISSRIVNEVPNVSRVVYDITTKPPATMEWE